MSNIIVFMSGFLIGLFGLTFWVWVILGGFTVVMGSLKGRWRLVVIGVLGVVVGVLRVIVADAVTADDVRLLNGTGVHSFTACISEEVDEREGVVKYTVSDVVVEGDVLAERSGKMRSGKILINASRYPVFEYGDVVRVVGEFEVPEPIADFAYDKYLSRYGIYSVVNNPVVSKVGDGCGSGWLGAIFEFKKVLEKRISAVFSEPHGSMVAGLLLGVRKGIPKDVTEDFNETGLTHIVAISGYNITLVIIVVFGMFGFLGRKARVVFACVFVAVFVILVGASSAVVRAGIMGILGLMAVYFGRKTEVAVSILLAAFLMNLWNPRIAVYDVGFQLSFLATLGLVYVSPRIEAMGGVFGRALARVPVAFAVRENLIMTLSAQAFALPVILKSFGRFSLICPLANIFVLPFIPFVMLFGFLALVFEWFGFVCYVLLDVVFFLIGVFADLSRAL